MEHEVECFGKLREFWKNGHKITLYKYIKNKKTNNIRIMILDDREDCECWKFNKPATEENYIEACDLCLKLFKGEEPWTDMKEQMF